MRYTWTTFPTAPDLADHARGGRSELEQDGRESRRHALGRCRLYGVD